MEGEGWRGGEAGNALLPHSVCTGDDSTISSRQVTGRRSGGKTQVSQFQSPLHSCDRWGTAARGVPGPRSRTEASASPRIWAFGRPTPGARMGAGNRAQRVTGRTRGQVLRTRPLYRVWIFSYLSGEPTNATQSSHNKQVQVHATLWLPLP